MRWLALVSVAFLLAAATAEAAASPAPKWIPQKWWNLGICESGHDPPNWKHNSGTYQGAFGFYHGTWDQYRLPGMPRDAHLATPQQQLQVAYRLYRLYGHSPWGCFRHSWVRYP